MNLRELYRRVAFNICIGNTDDHFRNHAFLLTTKGWTLSPAYDMNPTLNDHQSLLISPTSNKSDLNLLQQACESYLLTNDMTATIIAEVQAAVNTWKPLAVQLGINKQEMEQLKMHLKLS